LVTHLNTGKLVSAHMHALAAAIAASSGTDVVYHAYVI